MILTNIDMTIGCRPLIQLKQSTEDHGLAYVKMITSSEFTHHYILACCWDVKQTSSHIMDTALFALCLRCPPPEQQTQGLIPTRVMGDFPGCHTSDIKTGASVATLPGIWRYRVGTGTGWPSVRILWVRWKV